MCQRQTGIWIFCLPILYQNELVGRVDCKAHRTVKELEVISLHLEKR